ncbi:MAG TPA: AAA family ATPase [Clostridiaceae bacterium]
MFNVCSKCGNYRVDKNIDITGPYAICPDCGYAHDFIQLPLFIITGASGTGKTSVCLELSKALPEVIVMESDILWRNEFSKPESDYREYREMWLRVCKNISQSGKPVVLCGSAVPSQFEDCIERRYFTQIYYLALVCEDNVLSERLKQRPTWRNSNSNEFINEHIKFNNWFKDNADKSTWKIDLLDTSLDKTSDSVEKVSIWVRGRLQTV